MLEYDDRVRTATRGSHWTLAGLSSLYWVSRWLQPDSIWMGREWLTVDERQTYSNHALGPSGVALLPVIGRMKWPRNGSYLSMTDVNHPLPSNLSSLFLYLFPSTLFVLVLLLPYSYCDILHVHCLYIHVFILSCFNNQSELYI